MAFQGERDQQQAALHAPVHAALEAGQLVRGEQVLRHRAELDPALVDIAPLDRLASDDGFEDVGCDGLGRQFVGGVQEFADEAGDVPLVAHLGSGDAADGAGGQEAAREIEDLALAVLGGLAVQHDGAGLHQARGIGDLAEDRVKDRRARGRGGIRGGVVFGKEFFGRQFPAKFGLLGALLGVEGGIALPIRRPRSSSGPLFHPQARSRAMRFQVGRVDHVDLLLAALGGQPC